MGRCAENIGEEPAVVLEKSCDTLLRHDVEEDCYEPCPGDCVVDPWSQWSHCSQVGYVSIRVGHRIFRNRKVDLKIH